MRSRLRSGRRAKGRDRTCNLQLRGIRIEEFGAGFEEGSLGRTRASLLLNDLPLYDPSDDVVLVGFGDLAAVEVARSGRYPFRNIGDVKFAINFGRVHGAAALKQQVAFF